MDNIEAYLNENRQRNQDDLFELLRMASVSTDSQFQLEVERAGGWRMMMSWRGQAASKPGQRGGLLVDEQQGS